MADTPPTDVLGRIGSYRVVAFLGKGGVGAVYRAVEDFSKRQVALKVILPEHRENPELRMRFLQEARIGAQLQHPNIVQVLGGGEIRRARGAAEDTEPAASTPTLDGQELLDGTLYVVFELLEGPSLKDHLAVHGPMPCAEVPTRLAPLFDAVAYMHAGGFVHRDLKPGNVHFGDTLKVLDLGSAKASDEAIERFEGLERTTGANVPMTWEYRSPETFADPPELGAQVDLWALAGTVYRVVTGRVPFGGASDAASLVRRILASRYTPARTLDPSLPPGIDAFFARAFAPSPAERFPTVEAMRDALRDAVSEPLTPRLVAPAVAPSPAPETSVTPAPVTAPIAPRVSRRHWGIAAVVALAVGVLAVVLHRAMSADPPRVARIEAPTTASLPVVAAPASESAWAPTGPVAPSPPPSAAEVTPPAPRRVPLPRRGRDLAPRQPVVAPRQDLAPAPPVAPPERRPPPDRDIDSPS